MKIAQTKCFECNIVMIGIIFVIRKNKFAKDKMESIAYLNKKKMSYDIAFFFWEIQKK